MQDRWVKELRLAKVRTIEQANALVDKKLMSEFNRRFKVKPASESNGHRPLGPAHNLAAILSVQDVRTVGNDYTIRLENEFYQLLPPAWPGQRGGKVTASPGRIDEDAFQAAVSGICEDREE